jgi:hypothetical protein
VARWWEAGAEGMGASERAYVRFIQLHDEIVIKKKLMHTHACCFHPVIITPVINSPK